MTLRVDRGPSRGAVAHRRRRLAGHRRRAVVGVDVVGVDVVVDARYRASMRSLHEALDVVRLDESAFRLVVDDGWQQGRGAFGGLVVGALVRAALAATADPQRRVRSVTAELLGPVLVGEATLKVDRLRQGSGVSGVRVRLLQADGEGRPLDELCQAVVVTAKDRPQSPSWNHATPPAIPDWRLVDVAALAPPLAPVFTQHFEFRVTGAIPYTAQPVASASGFVRPVSGGVVDVAALAACADAWWPAALATFDAPRPMATITYALELHDVDIDAHEPLYFRSRADVARDGYCTEHRELWTPDGRLVASNQQLFAIIR